MNHTGEHSQYGYPGWLARVCVYFLFQEKQDAEDEGDK